MKHRLATSQDADRVFDILVKRAEWLDSKGIFQWPSGWMIHQEERIRLDVDRGLYRVCVINGHICATYRLSQQPEVYWDCVAEAVYVSKLAVAQIYSGKGLGREIMKQIERSAVASFVRLDCVSDSLFLQKFYQELGYRFIRAVTLPEITLNLYELKLGEQGGDVRTDPQA